MEIIKEVVVAKSRRLKATWTMDKSEIYSIGHYPKVKIGDISTYPGIAEKIYDSIDDEITDILAQEITKEIDKEILGSLRDLAEKPIEDEGTEI
jgi:hypothetical protein